MSECLAEMGEKSERVRELRYFRFLLLLLPWLSLLFYAVRYIVVGLLVLSVVGRAAVATRRY